MALNHAMPASGRPHRANKAKRTFWREQRNGPLYWMLLAPFIFILVFNILPVFGDIIAFERYNPLLGFIKSPFVGFKYFVQVLTDPKIWQVVRNSLFIAVGKILISQVAALVFALALNEILNQKFKRFVQSASYVLYFLSWVLLGGMVRDMLSMDGVINSAISALGAEPILFLANKAVFPWMLILTDVYKNFGFGAVVYLAALTNTDPALVEAAAVDGANRLQRIFNIFLPSIAPVIILLLVLNMGYVLDAGFDQVLVLYNPAVYATSDILDTYVYRGFVAGAYSPTTAVGLLKGIVGLVLISLSFYLAKRVSGYRVL